MDTTEQYIKMCESSKEIQKLVQHNLDNTYGSKEDFWGYSDRKGRLVWLPRQDQLQKMLKNTHTMGAIIQGLYWFYEPEQFCPDTDNKYRECKCSSTGIERRGIFETIEQVTLAFVMDELYKKKWNGSEWINDEKLKEK